MAMIVTMVMQPALGGVARACWRAGGATTLRRGYGTPIALDYVRLHFGVAQSSNAVARLGTFSALRRGSVLDESVLCLRLISTTTTSPCRGGASYDSGGGTAAGGGGGGGANRISVYTRTGDKGTSSLFNGARRSKDDAIFEALGTSDELNCHVGMSIHTLRTDVANTVDWTERTATERALFDELVASLHNIQCVLLDLGSAIATPPSSSNEARLHRVHFDGEALAEQLEQAIDRMDDVLPPLTTFILPGGSAASATLHTCRAVCRRLERTVTALSVDDTHPSVRVYVNRLSDYLFVAARFVASVERATEHAYKKPRQPRSGNATVEHEAR